MCSTSVYDLEDIPLEDDDPNSIEFKILAFYARHHVFKSTPAVFSPKLSRTRSLSQKALGTWSTDSWTQISLPCRDSLSSEKHISLGKKKSSWRTLFRVTEKEEEPPSSPKEIHAQGPFPVERQGRNQHWSRSLSSVEQCLESEAVDSKVACIANRVAEIVYSWPPPDDSQSQGGGKFKESVPKILHFELQGPQLRPCDSKKDKERQGFGEHLPGRAVLLGVQDHHRPVPEGRGHQRRVRDQSSGLQGCPCNRCHSQAHRHRQPPNEQDAGLWDQVPKRVLLPLGPAERWMGKNTWAIT
uniref:Bcl2-like 14 n=1 Tax=Rattus norvegicus TaxID=10116 RepID=A0ABK0LII0_RAT